ncbi:uncharacterized protein PHALS_13114 [Plasmopara halstedii]|uniref:Uncharacterized protein n=1 Tax=Plasmopara halstedii TaxID=4781 RepID=A0A0P1APU9_PLAHL|nr:uncharacterized protein PHALS_13114 [Plasmopara halstedii]CEG42877.1 hypothetical protein PHALS_13114 [Plasmopara halstedii]|eukprot:XP_024579246.1 hypothetical protein PHALS_13114 [Plasmopara halstedii]
MRRALTEFLESSLHRNCALTSALTRISTSKVFLLRARVEHKALQKARRGRR